VRTVRRALVIAGARTIRLHQNGIEHGNVLDVVTAAIDSRKSPRPPSCQ
jgi:hypothetical protein